MRLADTISTLATGFKTMLPALIILTLAWSLATTTEELHTATFLTSALKDTINPYLMPVLIFILSAVIAFSTGSSWSTMAILYPIAIPTTWAICQAQGIPEEVAKELLYNVISVVLAASVLGDHCSPISDTTILSSLASQCNHIDHVRTQLPYALLVGIVSATAGGVSTLLGGGWLICTLLLFLSLGTLFFIVWRFGKLVD
jgi:Na+/H+ antiporter NhaC